MEGCLMNCIFITKNLYMFIVLLVNRWYTLIIGTV